MQKLNNSKYDYLYIRNQANPHKRHRTQFPEKHARLSRGFSLFWSEILPIYFLVNKKKKGNNTLHPDFEILHKFECIIIYLAFREKSLADLKQILTPSEKA